MCCEHSWALLKNFKTLTIASSAVAYTCASKYFANRKTTAAASFTMSVTSVKNGGDYNFVVLKNTASDVVVTLPAGSKVSGSAASTITLTGASGLYFWISFTYDGTYYYFTLHGSSSGSSGSSALVVEEVTASRNLTAADKGKQLNVNSVTPVTLTIPTGLDMTPDAFNVVVKQMGAGKVTIAAAVGVTLQEPDAQYSTAKQYAKLSIVNDGLTPGDEIYCIAGYTAV